MPEKIIKSVITGIWNFNSGYLKQAIRVKLGGLFNHLAMILKLIIWSKYDIFDVSI